MVPANGLLYSGPWLCDCNLSIMGAIAQCSAKDFDPAAIQGARVAYSDRPVQLPTGWMDRADWYTYRGNNEHNGASHAGLSRALLPVWTWNAEKKVSKESGSFPTTPTTGWGKVFLAGEDGKVCAIDAATGLPAWTYSVSGPIMQSPTLWKGRVFVGSGNGYVYALEAATGQLLWQFRAAPVERRTMIYGFLNSTWPVNSGVVVRDGVAYFAAA